MIVSELPTDYYYKWIDSENAKDMVNYFGRHDWLEYFRLFLVWIEDGEYKEVYGCVTETPYLESEAEYLIKDGQVIDSQTTTIEDFKNFNEFMMR